MPLKMVYAPPPYPATAYRQLWAIIAPYVRSEDLHSCCLVSQQWHQVFAPFLWGNPAARFGPDYDLVYLSITHFKRLLSRSRPEVRRLAHTLQIPPAEAEFYDGLQAGWLREILDRLPSLQSLIASRLSFFDHQALQALDQPPTNPNMYPLRLLIAAGCENTTAIGLRTALRHFPDLIYLDLSGTQGVRSPHVLQLISTLWDLKVLRLCRCGLRDEDLDLLTFSTHLLSLDLSNNFLTEKGITRLLKRLPPAVYGPPSPYTRRYSSVPLPKKVLATGIESYVYNHLTSGRDGYLYIEEGLPTSFSQLYLKGNYVTVDSLAKSLTRINLDHLDCGSLSLSQSTKELLPPSGETHRFSYTPPEKQILSHGIFSHSFRNLRSLRIHHSVVTTYPFSGDELPVAEQCFELHSEDLRFELDSSELRGPVFELGDTSVEVAEPPGFMEEGCGTTASFESPDDVGTSPVACHYLGPRSASPTPLSPLNNRGRSNSATPSIAISHHPTQVSGDDIVSPISPTFPSGIPDGPIAFRNIYSAGEERSWNELKRKPIPSTVKELIYEIIQRRHRTAARERYPGRFKPSMLPNLKALTLTDVPIKSKGQELPDSISLFIQECAEDEELARLEDIATKQDPNLAPQEILYSQTPLKLQQIILEMGSGPDPVEAFRAPGTPRAKRLSFTKSSTEDAECESFMSAREGDFSFFAEDDGGLLVSKGRIDAPVAFDNGKMLGSGVGFVVDVVSQLASFRRERKLRYEGSRRFEGGLVERAFLGHWRGEIKVIKEVVP